VHASLGEGIHGWQVTDCLVTLTDTGYWPRQSHAHATFDKSMSSTARDFRRLTPLVLITALRTAGTRVCEPIHRFELEIPDDVLGTVLGTLPQFRAHVQATEASRSGYVVIGEIPAATVQRFREQLPELSRGEGVLDSRIDHYRPVAGTTPVRPRTDSNPLDRQEYLRAHGVR
jgi:ribosomal protection tetracycline resistance protein